MSFSTDFNNKFKQDWNTNFHLFNEYLLQEYENFSSLTSDIEDRLNELSSSNKVQEFLPDIDFNFLAKLNLSINLFYDFRKELAEKKDLIDGKENIYRETFNYVAKAIIPLRPLKIDAKITVSNSIYLKFLLDNKYWIRLELFLDDIQSFNPKKIKVVLNIDEGDEQIFGTYCNVDNAISYLFEQVGNLTSKINFPEISSQTSNTTTASREENVSLTTGFVD